MTPQKKIKNPLLFQWKFGSIPLAAHLQDKTNKGTLFLKKSEVKKIS